MSGTTGPIVFPFPPAPIAASTAAAAETTRAEAAELLIDNAITGLQAAIVALQGVTSTVTVGTPTLIAPPTVTAVASSTIILVGVTFTDPNTSVPASYPMTVSCLHGTLSVAGFTGGTLLGSGTLSVTGGGSLAAIQAQLAAISYTAPATGAADTITILVTRSAQQSYTAAVAVTVGAGTGTGTTGVVGAPVLLYSTTSFAATTGTALRIPGFIITDAPASLSGKSGTLVVSVAGASSTIAMTPGGVAVAGSGTSSITINGTVLALNSALSNLYVTGNVAGAATISAVYTDPFAAISPVVVANVTVTGATAAQPPATPVGPADPSLSVPTLAISPGGAHKFTNIYWRDSYGASNTGLAVCNLTCANGTITVALQGATTVPVGTNGSNSMRLSGVFADIVACLANITYAAPSSAGSDSMNVDCYNGFGIEYHAPIAITISASNAIGLPATITIAQNTTHPVSGVVLASTVAAATPAGPYTLSFFTNQYYGGDVTFSSLGGCTLVSGGTAGLGAKGAVISGTYSQLQAAIATLRYGSFTSQPDSLVVYLDSGSTNLLTSNSSTITITAGATYAQGAVPTSSAATETGGYSGTAATGGTTTTTTTTTSTGTSTTAATTTVSGVVSGRLADWLDNFVGFNTFSNWGEQGGGGPTDLSSTWGSYPCNNNSSMVVSMANWLVGSSGLRLRFREYHNDASSAKQAPWMIAVNLGTGSVFELAGQIPESVTSSLALAALLATASTTGGPIIDMVEPINEPNLNSWSAAQNLAGQQQVAAGVKNLAGVSSISSSIVIGAPYPAGYITGYVGGTVSQVATPTSTQLASYFSINNAHVYPPTVGDLDDGSNNKGFLGDVVNAYLAVFPSNKPLRITEYHPTYYINYNASVTKFNPVYDCYYYMWFLFSAFRNYQALAVDWFCICDYSNIPCGLFGSVGVSAPRLQAYSLRALFQLTGDTGTNKHTFTVVPFAYSISGMAGPINAASPFTGGQSMCLQSSDGRVFIFFGNQQQDPGGTASNAVITFAAGTVTSVAEYDLTTDPVNAMTAKQTQANVSSITSSLNASFRVLVIHR